jgi:glycine/D-amino acid oxidase-like deaminating enzyme/nitrite reductase/ring-hydroxylating ferredoxin subunit
MPNASGRTTSSWMATADVPAFEPLSGDARVDACVVGAGIAGMSTAYELARRGKSVLVIDDNPIGGGESGRTTGHLSDALDEQYYALEFTHGTKGARLAFESHRAAIDRIGEIARKEGIDCDYQRVDGYLIVAEGQSQDELDEELQACHRVGKTDVAFADRAPLPGFDSGRCLRHPGQGQFHILKYLNGLAGAIAKRGGRICTGTHVRKIHDGSPCRVETSDGHTVEADAVVAATCTPISDYMSMHTKIYPYRTYVVALRLPAGAVPTVQVWDTADPYHYARLQPVHGADGQHEYDLLIVGGEDHRTGSAQDMDVRLDRLESWTRTRYPEANAVEYRWSGQVFEPVDGLGFIGRDAGGKKNVYICTGDSGHGLTHGTIAGMLIPELIDGIDHPWATLYDPSRKSLRNLRTFAEENLDVAAKYADWLTGGDVAKVEQIEPGQGAVVREGLKKVAVYRDDAGNLHRLSAVCTHLQGIVRWNPLEKSWDCPCHGARYDVEGRVITGPALTGLEKVD